MAGKRQHFVPRFLQAGFADEKGHAWTYRRDNAPFKVSTKNIGLENLFYTYPDDTEADDLITDAERSYSYSVKILRETGTVLSSAEIAELIAHMEVRTRNLREGFLTAGDYFVTRILEKFSDEQFLKNMLIRKIKKDDSLIKEEIDKIFSQNRFRKILIWPVTKFVQFIAPYLIEKNMSSMAPLFEHLKFNLPKILKEAAKSGHIKSFKGTISPPVKVDEYKKLNYRVVDIPGRNLVLGDSIVFFNTAESGYKTFNEKGKTILEVFLPISSHQILVGYANEIVTPISKINEIIAQCSLEFFISKDNSPENTFLQKEIGKKAALISEEEMDNILLELIQEW